MIMLNMYTKLCPARLKMLGKSCALSLPHASSMDRRLSASGQNLDCMDIPLTRSLALIIVT